MGGFLRKQTSKTYNVITMLFLNLGRVFFNIAGINCYKYDHPIKRCAEYIDVTRMSKIPPWILRMLNIHPEPKRPRCRK